MGKFYHAISTEKIDGKGKRLRNRYYGNIFTFTFLILYSLYVFI
jgi:hypothetical protein